MLGHVLLLLASVVLAAIDPQSSFVDWTGVKNIHQPVYYFHVYLRDATAHPLRDTFLVQFEHGNGKKTTGEGALVDRHDGSYIYRWRPRRHLDQVTIHVTDMFGRPFKNSGRTLTDVNNGNCVCPVNPGDFMRFATPSMNFDQIDQSFEPFGKIDTAINNALVKERFCKHPGAVSICKYRISSNRVYRSCFGDHVGFSMFSDDILLQLARMIALPELEFWMNLGDWPQQKKVDNPAAVVSWCGHQDYTDIVVPTYDVAESTMHMMHKVAQDQFSLQHSARAINWDEKRETGFFRGRDSNEQRLKLARMSKDNPELVDAGITNFFFYPKDASIQKAYVPFDDHFYHKYQISIDGTVAAYRLPNLLLSNSIVLKQKSPYYEHFYSLLNVNEPHHLEIEHDLSNLEAQLEWIRSNNDQAIEMIKNVNRLMDEVLSPINVYAYWLRVLQTYAAKSVGPFTPLDEMELIPQPRAPGDCQCGRSSTTAPSTPHSEL